MIELRQNSKPPELDTEDPASPEPGPDAEQGIVNDDGKLAAEKRSRRLELSYREEAIVVALQDLGELVVRDFTAANPRVLLMLK